MNVHENLKNLEEHLNSTNVPPSIALQNIAVKKDGVLRIDEIPNFYKKLAKKLTKYKLEDANVDYERKIINYENNRFNFKIFEKEFLDDDSKKNIIHSIKPVANLIKNGEFDGVVYFMPFQCNSYKMREIIKAEIPAAFVNLKYTDKSISRDMIKLNMRYQWLKE